MGKTAEKKKNYILQQAAKVFGKKGYKNVTMKDIIDECGISRGGIYIYFQNTQEIFSEILKLQAQDHLTIPFPSDENGCSALDILQNFLDSQKEELLSPSHSLAVATYEYYSTLRDKDSTLQLQEEFNNSVSALAALLQAGVDSGNFSTTPLTAAQHIVLYLEGLRLAGIVLPLDEHFIDQQFSYLLNQLTGGQK